MITPSLRIAILLAFAAALAFATAPLAALLAACVCATNVVHGPAQRARLVALLRRSRWLLLMVVVLNAWATPGAAAWPEAPRWAPSAAGLTLALHRTAALVAMLAAVNLLLGTTSIAEVVRGIAAFGAPLRVVGARPETFAARLGGALALLAETERDLRTDAGSGGWAAAVGRRILAIEARAARGG